MFSPELMDLVLSNYPLRREFKIYNFSAYERRLNRLFMIYSNCDSRGFLFKLYYLMFFHNYGLTSEILSFKKMCDVYDEPLILHVPTVLQDYLNIHQYHNDWHEKLQKEERKFKRLFWYLNFHEDWFSEKQHNLLSRWVFDYDQLRLENDKQIDLASDIYEKKNKLSFNPSNF